MKKKGASLQNPCRRMPNNEKVAPLLKNNCSFIKEL